MRLIALPFFFATVTDSSWKARFARGLRSRVQLPVFAQALPL